MPLVMFLWWDRRARLQDVYLELNMMEAFRVAQAKNKDYEERITGGMQEIQDIQKGVTQEEKWERNFQALRRCAVEQGQE